MDRIWNLYFTLQIMCYITEYDTPLPGNAVIYLDEFTKLVEFEILKPEPLIQIFYPDFSLKECILGQNNNFVSKDQEASLLDDFFIFILFGAVFVMVLLIMLLVKVFKKYR